MTLASLTAPDLIFPGISAPDASSVLRALSEKVRERGRVVDAQQLYRKLCEREELGSTGIGSGVAIPHCKLAGLDEVVLAVGISPEGVDFGAVDGEPVKVFFLLISPDDAPAEHLQSLATISRWIKNGRHRERILDLRDAAEIYSLLGDDGG